MTKRTDVIQFRVSTEERDVMTRLAERADMTLSTWIRSRALEESTAVQPAGRGAGSSELQVERHGDGSTRGASVRGSTRGLKTPSTPRASEPQRPRQRKGNEDYVIPKVAPRRWAQ